MYSPRKLTLIAAMDLRHVIGKAGDIPWAGRLRADMDHFKDYTMGKIVVMGRKTWDSIPDRFKPLVGRENLVLTRNWNFPDIGRYGVVRDYKAIERISHSREVCVLGGGEIYKALIPTATKLVLTYINTVVEDGDTFFPYTTRAEWPNSKLLFEQNEDEKNKFAFSVFEHTR